MERQLHMFSAASADELSALLSDFLSDKPDCDSALRGFLKPIINRFCVQRASNLPVDLREEVLQETLLILLGNGCSQYQSELNTAPGYVYSSVRTALQSIRRRYGLTPTRVASRVADFELESAVDQSQSEGRVLRGLLANEILRFADPAMRRVLWRVYVNEEVQEVALAEAKMSRFAFARKRKAIARSLSELDRAA
jgi:hypothetical protein